MIKSICLLGLVLPAANPPLNQQTADRLDDAAQLRQQVVSALLQHRLDGFEGTVTFEKEFWFPPKDRPVTPADATGYSRQRWEITTDGRKSVVARLEFLEGSNNTFPFIAGEDTDRIWRAIGRELYVYEKDAFAQARDSDPLGLGGTQQLIEQAWNELEAVFSVARLVAPGLDVDEQVVSARQVGDTVDVIAKRGDDTYHLALKLMDGNLQPVSMQSQDPFGPSKWTFSGYYRAVDRWVPETVQWEGMTPEGERKIMRTSQIRVNRISDRSALAEVLKVPSRARGPYKHLVIALVVTAEGTEDHSIRP
jgi:hypothetical protein